MFVLMIPIFLFSFITFFSIAVMDPNFLYTETLVILTFIVLLYKIFFASQKWKEKVKNISLFIAFSIQLILFFQWTVFLLSIFSNNSEQLSHNIYSLNNTNENFTLWYMEYENIYYSKVEIWKNRFSIKKYYNDNISLSYDNSMVKDNIWKYVEKYDCKSHKDKYNIFALIFDDIDSKVCKYKEGILYVPVETVINVWNR